MPLTSDERFAALVEALSGTEASLERGEGIYKDLRKSVRRQRAVLWVAVIGLVADLLLSGGLLLGFMKQNQTSNDVRANQANVHTVECDLNTLFIQVDTPQSYATAPDRAQYVAQFHTIYQARIQLQCQPPIPEPTRPAL
jgi:hypothetical protein